MLPGLGAQAALAVVDRQGAGLQARFTARRDNAADAEALRAGAQRMTDVESLLKDRRALRMVLEAFQLESEIDKRALIRRALTEDPAEKTSLVNRFTDRRWREFAAAFAEGRPPGQSAEEAAAGTGARLRGMLDRIVRDAMVNRYEKAMGESNPGLREALYFRRVADRVTTVPQLMADRALVEVARGALGLPKQFGLLSFEQQRDLLTRRLDMAQLQDPKGVARLVGRYLAQANTAPPPSPVAALFDSKGSANGIAALAGRRLSIQA
jgi:hypothetical protein